MDLIPRHVTTAQRHLVQLAVSPSLRLVDNSGARMLAVQLDIAVAVNWQHLQSCFWSVLPPEASPSISATPAIFAILDNSAAIAAGVS